MDHDDVSPPAHAAAMVVEVSDDGIAWQTYEMPRRLFRLVDVNGGGRSKAFLSAEDYRRAIDLRNRIAADADELMALLASATAPTKKD